MNELFLHVWHRKYVFLGTFFVVFVITYVFFMALDFLPEPQSEVDEEQSVMLTSAQERDARAVVPAEQEPVTEEEFDVAVAASSDSVLPTAITIPRLSRTVPILNPTSRTIADLDAALLEGVVRHPDSANLAQDGNVFILGHSSYLPNVMNRNFQAFNGIEKLEWGDVIEVVSADAVYEYRVEKVYRARAQDVTVPIAGTGQILTLATCNSFGSVDDRFIVEAKRIGVTAL